MRRPSPRAAALAAPLLAAALAVAPPGRAEPVELELVLAVDASSSVNRAEFDLQMTGIAKAFRAPAVLNAIEALGGRGIAVGLLQWSGDDRQRWAVDWVRVDDAASAAAFAETVAATPRYVVSGGTAIGQAVVAAQAGLAANAFEGRRQAIDVSGDGRANVGLRPEVAGARAAADGITVNGLAILNEELDLDRYYVERVIAGTGAFLITAEGYDDFATAIRRKLVQEIAGAPVARRGTPTGQEAGQEPGQEAGQEPG